MVAKGQDYVTMADLKLRIYHPIPKHGKNDEPAKSRLTSHGT